MTEFDWLPDEVSMEGARLSADWTLFVASSSGYDGGDVNLRALLVIVASTDEGRKMLQEILDQNQQPKVSAVEKPAVQP